MVIRILNMKMCTPSQPIDEYCIRANPVISYLNTCTLSQPIDEHCVWTDLIISYLNTCTLSQTINEFVSKLIQYTYSRQ